MVQNCKKSKTKVLPCGREVPTNSSSLSEAQLDKWHVQLKAYLEREGLRYSEQRWKMAKFIIERSGHYNAQEIVREMLKSFPDIGAATVYRNIKVLCDAMILKETLVDGVGRIVYESFEDRHHDHIVCVDCGEIFEFHDPEIESIQDRVTKNLHFKPVRHRHVVYAKCELLSEKGNPRGRSRDSQKKT